MRTTSPWVLILATVHLGAAEWIPAPDLRPRQVLEAAMEDSTAGRSADAVAKLRWLFMDFPRRNPDEAGYLAIGPSRMLHRLATRDDAARRLRDEVVAEHGARMRSGESTTASYAILSAVVGATVAKSQVRALAAAGATTAVPACQAALMDLTDEDAAWAWPHLDHGAFADALVASHRRSEEARRTGLFPPRVVDEMVRQDQDRMIRLIRLARSAGATVEADRLATRATVDMGIDPARISPPPAAGHPR
jgi:hypothetical protein